MVAEEAALKTVLNLLAEAAAEREALDLTMEGAEVVVQTTGSGLLVVALGEPDLLKVVEEVVLQE